MLLDTVGRGIGEFVVMKKALLVVVVLALLAAAGALLFLGKRGISDGAALLPANTVIYAAIPDVARTSQRWPQTALAKIAAEPAVAEFFARPLTTFGAGGGGEAAEILARLKPGRFFVALTSLGDAPPEGVLGFQYFGGQESLTAAMERLHAELAARFPSESRSTSDYHGVTITSFGGPMAGVHTASHGNWGLLASSEAALQGMLDRAAGRDTSDSLASSEVFRKVMSQLPSEPDFVWFADFQPIFDLLLRVGEQQGGDVNEAQIAQIRKLKAAGGSLLFAGEDQREMSFALMDDIPKLPALNHALMELTVPDTTVFIESAVDRETISSEDYLQTLPEPVQEFLADAQLDGGRLASVLGDEMGAILKWGAGAMIPSVLVGVTIEDRARVDEIVTGAVARDDLDVTVRESHGAKVFEFPSFGGLQLVSPAVAITDRFLLASLTIDELERVLDSNDGGKDAKTLKDSEAFKPALDLYRGSNQAFAFIDAKTIFENIYNQLRPILVIAGTMSPDMAKVIDVEKLPDTEVISRHLSPILYTNRQTADGIIVESSGPITFSQGAGLVGVGAAFFIVSQLGATFGN